MLVLEPIFEADLLPEQHAYRAEKSALDAVQAVQRHLDAGYTAVVDADLSGYFDSIPHAELMKSVARRVSDRHLLHLIKGWLEAPVEERDEHGERQRTTRNRDEGRGTPQGGVLSPLLANVYMRRFLLGWKTQGHETRLKAHIVNYADDFVICTRGHADEAMAAMQTMMQKLKLTVNERKTRCCHLPDESFTFLGYTFGTCYSRRTGRAYISAAPSDKKIQGLCAKLSDLTDRRTVDRDTEEVVGRINQKLHGWANYFCLGPVLSAYTVVTQHVRRRLRRWLCVKHKVRTRQYGRFPNEYLHDDLSLEDLTQCRTHRSLWAKA